MEKVKNDSYKILLDSLIEYGKNASKSRKVLFDYSDAIKFRDLYDERHKTLVDAFKFINSNPLRENDYYKFLNVYTTKGKKLNEKYFRHDLKLLHELYERYKDEKTSRFCIENFNVYVLFMCLKLNGQYQDSDDEIFNVTYKDNREYNPLSKIPSIIRGCLPFEVMEFDIKRAFPTFIDIELNSDYRTTVYERISKKEFAMYLNCNAENNLTLEQTRKGLSIVYGAQTNQVLTDERYNEKGRVFKDFTKYEKEYIEKFVSKNNLKNYARLHDGVFTLADTKCEHLKFDIVEFSIKKCIKPEVVNETKSFYTFGEKGQVITSPSMYADFLIQEDFKRISIPDDKIFLLRNKNNVIDYFNHKTNMVSFLESEINEFNCDAVRDAIARDNFNVLAQSYTLIPPTQLTYYKDTKTSFGLPFKNGFFYFDEVGKTEINQKKYSDVNGFFTPLQTQKHEFDYTDNVGDFETFIQRIATGVKDYSFTNSEHTKQIHSLMSIFGYLIHNHKSLSETYAIVLTDEGANGITRNGGRGKTQIIEAIKFVTKTMVKGGDEFAGDYQFKFDDLDKSYNVFAIDDVPAGFNYNDLYTNITGGINAHKKGKQAIEIDFYDSPKFLISSNWVLRYNSNDDSTNRRFKEFKLKPYYNINHKPQHEFKNRFFEEWDNLEWNKFYSFMFRCVTYYLMNGIEFTVYDKTKDNFDAEFYHDAHLQEMERIMNILINPRGNENERKIIRDFTVSDFLNIYNKFDNPMKTERFFHTKNVKRLVDVYLKKHEMNYFVYEPRTKKYVYERKFDTRNFNKVA